MAAQTLARPGRLTPDQQAALREAGERMRQAQLAFGGLLSLLADCRNHQHPQELYELLRPIELEYRAAYNCIEVVQ